MAHDWAGLIKAIEAIPENAGRIKTAIFIPDKTYFDNKKQRQQNTNPLTGDVYENAGQ